MIDETKYLKEKMYLTDAKEHLHTLRRYAGYNARVISRTMQWAETSDLRNDVKEEIQAYFAEHKRAEYVVLEDWIFFTNYVTAEKAVAYALISSVATYGLKTSKNHKEVLLWPTSTEGLFEVLVNQVNLPEIEREYDIDALVSQIAENAAEICERTGFTSDVIVHEKNSNYDGGNSNACYCKIQVVI